MPASLRSLVPHVVVDALFPPDPGALRLRAAFAATLAGVLTFFLVMALGTIVAIPVTDRIFGFAIALFIAANLRDPTPRQRLTTIALAPFVAFAATALASLLLNRPLAAAMVGTADHVRHRRRRRARPALRPARHRCADRLFHRPRHAASHRQRCRYACSSCCLPPATPR